MKYYLYILFFFLSNSVIAGTYNGCPDFTDLNADYVTTFASGRRSNQPIYNRHTMISEEGTDHNTRDVVQYVPDGETKVVRLGNQNVGAEYESINYRFIPDKKYPILLIRFAVVFQDPGHNMLAQPSFSMNITDKNGRPIDKCADYKVYAKPYLDGFQRTGNGDFAVMFRDWTYVGLDLSDYVGEELSVKFETKDCAYGAHYGYAYFTAKCISNHIEVKSCSLGRIELSAPIGFEKYEWDDGYEGQEHIRAIEPGKKTMWCDMTSAIGCSFKTYINFTDEDLSDISEFVNDTICEGENYKWNNEIIETSYKGTKFFPYVLINTKTCQSIDRLLQLTTIDRINTYYAEICEGENYEGNGFKVINPPVGTYIDTMIVGKKKGCDILNVLNLRVFSNFGLERIDGPLTPCTREYVQYKINGNNVQYTWSYSDNVIVDNEGEGSVINVMFSDTLNSFIAVYCKNGCGEGESKIQIKPKESIHSHIMDTVCQGTDYNRYGFKLGRQNKIGVYNHIRYINDDCNSTETLSLYVVPTSKPIIISDTVICQGTELQLKVVSDSIFCELNKQKDDIRVGDVLCEDGEILRFTDYLASNKKAKGIVYIVDESGQHGFAISVVDELNGVSSYYDGAGQGISSTSGDYYDLVDYKTLEILMLQSDIINSELEQISGADIIKGRYWSSTYSNQSVFTITDEMEERYQETNTGNSIAKFRRHISF